MPPPPHIIGAAAWFWLFVLQPLITHYGLSKPRLAPQSMRLDLLLQHPERCQEVMRFYPREMRQLCHDLLINPDERVHGNWRFRPLHRLMLALWCLGNHLTLRKGRHVFGWASGSLSNNLHEWVDVIVDRLDADGSRTYCSSHTRALHELPAHHSCCLCSVCSVCAQLIASLAGRWMSSERGSLTRRGQHSSTTASALWTRRTCASSDRRCTLMSVASTPSTRSTTLCSSCASWIDAVSD
jgi:hypothetical protein